MEITPEVKKQLEEQKKNCPFCKIIAGEIPSKKVFEDDLVVALLDINPATKGHVLVMTKEHYPIMPYIPPEEFKRLFERTRSLCSSIQKAMVTNSSTVFIANGFAAGQQAPHFMLHVIPREKGDGLDKLKLSGKELDSDKLSEAHKLLANNLPIMMANHFKRNPVDWHTSSGDVGSKAFTKEQVIAIIEENTQLKKLVEEHPDMLADQVDKHPQLSQLFKDVAVVDVIKHFHPDYEEKVDAEVTEETSKEDVEDTEAFSEDNSETEEEPETAEKEDDILGALGGAYDEDEDSEVEEDGDEEPESDETTDEDDTDEESSEEDSDEEDDSEEESDEDEQQRGGHGDRSLDGIANLLG